MGEEKQLTQLRVDKWLWAVRLFKTRTFAGSQCAAGKIKRDGKSLKASAAIKPGDKLTVPAPDGTFKREIEVVELYDKRVGAPIAQAAYLDSTPAEILKQAQQVRSENRINRQTRKEGDQGRMTKKQRRDWRKGLGSSKDPSES